MSAGPARIFGLDRPRVAAGARANLVLLDLGREWTVGEQPFRSRSGNSWLLGSRLKGAVRMTLAGGAPVFEASKEHE
jgi:dihydroorotase